MPAPDGQGLHFYEPFAMILNRPWLTLLKELKGFRDHQAAYPYADIDGFIHCVVMFLVRWIPCLKQED